MVMEVLKSEKVREERRITEMLGDKHKLFYSY